MRHVVVVQRGLLRIGGVVAAGAGLIGVPADFGAAGRLRIVRHVVVVQRGLLHVGGVVAAGAGFVGVPADMEAGRGLRVVGFEGVGVRISLAIAALAIRAVGRGGAGGRRSLCVVCGCPIDRMPAVSIGDLCRVLGLGGFHMGGCGRANVVARVFFSVSTAA